jgi:hypothetical protein
LVTIGALPWRTRRLPGTALGEPVDRGDPVGASPRRQRSYARAERAGTAAAADDRFLDAIVLTSVVVFVLLVAGVGMLVLQAALKG